MTTKQHLPECPWADRGYAFPCICDRLRACERRAYALGIEVGKHDGWIAGRADGVDAARDAVAALPVNVPKADALAAIDALRGESE